jgi:hypothetical protein
MHPARRLAATALGVLAALTLAACSDGAPSVLVSSDAMVRIPSPAPSAAAPGDPTAMALAAPAAPAPEARRSPGAGVLIDGLGLLHSEQHDVAFGTVINPTAAAVRVTLDVTTYDDGNTVLSTDNTTDVEVPAGGSTLFVADVITPEGTVVARMDAAHSVAVPLSAAISAPGAPVPSLTVRGQTIHADQHNPTITGRVVSSYPRELQAVRVTAVCTADGEPVAAGYGRVPIVAAGGSAAYEVTLYGATPDACDVTATP